MRLPLSYMGDKYRTPRVIYKQRAPTTGDRGFNVGDIWADVLAHKLYMCEANINSVATWNAVASAALDWQESVISATTAEAAATATEGNRYISPAAGATWTIDNIYQYHSGVWQETAASEGMTTWIEDTNQTEVYDGTNWVSLASAIPDMTATVKGVGELATDAESIAGTATDYHVINPSSLKAKLGTQTDHGVLVGSGTTAALTALAVGTNGQVIVGSTGADPVFATVASTDSSVSFALGAGTLALTVTQASTAQLGGSTLATGAEVTTGSNATKIVTPDTLETKLGTMTANGVILGGGAGANLAATAAGTNGQVVVGSTGVVPVFATIGSTDSSVTVTAGAGTLALTVTQAAEAQLGGAKVATDAETLTGTSDALMITPDKLNHKLGTQTLHGMLVGGATTAAVTALAVGTNGQVVIGSTGADPVFGTISSTDSSVTVGVGAGTLDLSITAAGEAQAGGLETATDVEAVAITVTDKIVVPSNLGPVLASPPAIGGTAPAAGAFTAITGTSLVCTEDVSARTLFAVGDEGTGVASTVAITNVVDETLSSGAGVVLMKTTNSGNSSGWLKIYNGTSVRYVPYWSDISP